MDSFADILRAMHLTGGVFLDARFTAPWCVMSSVGPEDLGRLGTVSRSIIAFHYVYAGQLLLDVDAHPPVVV
jgi:hypothetical protein